MEPIGPLIVRLRCEDGISQYSLAERLVEVSANPSMTREQVNRWEHHKRIPTPYWRRHLAAVFDLPVRVLDKAAALARDQRAALKSRVGSETDVPPEAVGAAREVSMLGTLEVNLETWDELMRRRDFLAGTGAAAVVTVLTPKAAHGFDPLTSTAGPAAGAHADLLEVHEQLHAAHGRLENLHGPAAVFRPAQLHHQQLFYWYRRVTAPADRRRVAGLVGVTGGFMGWLNFDLARFEEAVTWFRQAASLAAEAGDAGLYANNLGQAARALAAAGQHPEALISLDLAIAAAGTAAHPAVRSWLHAVRADQHARHGDRRAAEADLGVATRVLERVDDGQVPVYIGYLDAAEVNKWIGHALVRLGAASRSVLGAGTRAIESAREGWPADHVRGLAEVLTTTSRARLAGGDVDAGTALLRQAHAIAVRTGSARNLLGVHQVRAEMEPYQDSRAVRELDEYLLS